MDRFWSKVDRRGPDDCWLWLGGRTSKGYGGFSQSGKDTAAHRTAWERQNGPIPEGMDVLHKCDNPPCCNPRHLFLGTNSANMADRNAKGRQAKGIENGAAKLTDARVEWLHRRRASGTATQKELASILGVTQQSVSLVLNNRRWGHVNA